MIGYTRDSMGLNQDTLVKVKSSQCATTSRILWMRGISIDVIIKHFSKAFDLDPRDRLITKLSDSGVNARVVVWVREFLVGRTQKSD